MQVLAQRDERREPEPSLGKKLVKIPADLRLRSRLCRLDEHLKILLEIAAAGFG